MAKRRKAYILTKYNIRKMKRFIKKHPFASALFALVLAVLVVFGAKTDEAPAPMDGLNVHFIDVGQGDCELVQCGEDFLLIDAGTPESGESVLRYLRSHGVKRLAYLVSSHGDSDHCGGLDTVIEAIPCEKVFISPYNEDKVSFRIFLEAVDAEGLTPTMPELGESYTLGDAEFCFLAPGEDFGDNNENSLVLRLTYGETVFLFTGDIQRNAETALLDDGADVKCDVLKIAHHGSNSSTSYRFLYEAEPKLAVISCGKGNSYGHPHEEVLSRLSDAEVTVYRTDTDGTVIIHSDGKTAERSGT